jgi:hypothetical protein
MQRTSLPCQPGEVVAPDPALVERDLLEARDLEALTVLDRLDEVRCLEQRLVRPGVEPRHAAAHQLDAQLAARQIREVHVGDLELAPGGGLEARGDLQHAVVVEIDPRDGVVGARARRLLLDAHDRTVGCELHHAVALGVAHPVAEDGGAGLALRRPAQLIRQAVAIEHVVPQRERHGVTPDETAPDQEGLGQPLRTRLLRVGDGEPDVAAVAEQTAVRGQVVGRGDEQDLAHVRQHQRRERVVHHGLVVDGQQLLADTPGDGVEPRARPAREHDALHGRKLAV